jgi:hypothetical protein
MFISFLFDLTGRSRPEAVLNPEPLNLEPQKKGRLVSQTTLFLFYSNW